MTALYADHVNTVSKKQREEALNIADFSQTSVRGKQDGLFKRGQAFGTSELALLENGVKGGISTQIKHMENENILAFVSVIITCFSMHRLDAMAFVQSSNVDTCAASLNYIYGILTVVVIAFGACAAALIFLLNWKSLGILSPPCTEIMIWKFNVLRKKTRVLRKWMIRLVLVVAVCYILSFCMNPDFWCKYRWVSICTTTLLFVGIFLLFLWYQCADILCCGASPIMVKGCKSAMRWNEVFPCCIDIFRCLRKKWLMNDDQLTEEWVNSDADISSWSQTSSAQKFSFPEMAHRKSVTEKEHREAPKKKVPIEQKVRGHNIHQKNNIVSQKKRSTLIPNLHRQSVVVDSPSFQEVQHLRHVHNHQQVVNPMQSTDFSKKDEGGDRKKLQFRIRNNLKNPRYIQSIVRKERGFFGQMKRKPYANPKFDNDVAYESSRRQYQNIIQNANIENYQRASSVTCTSASESDTLLKMREEEEIAKRFGKNEGKTQESRGRKQPAILSRNDHIFHYQKTTYNEDELKDEIISPRSFSGYGGDNTSNYADVQRDSPPKRNPNSQIIWEETFNKPEINCRKDTRLENHNRPIKFNRRTRNIPTDANKNNDLVGRPSDKMRIYLNNPNRTSYSSLVNLSSIEHQTEKKPKGRSKPVVFEREIKVPEIPSDSDDSKKNFGIPHLNLHGSSNERKSPIPYKQRPFTQSKVHAELNSHAPAMLVRTDTTSPKPRSKTERADTRNNENFAIRSRTPSHGDKILRNMNIHPDIEEFSLSGTACTGKSALLDSREREILLNSDSTNTVVSGSSQSGSESWETSSTVSESRSEEVINSLHQMFSEAKSVLDSIVSQSDPGSDAAEMNRTHDYSPQGDKHNSQVRISSNRDNRDTASANTSNLARNQSDPKVELSSSQVSRNRTLGTLVELPGMELSYSGSLSGKN